MSPEQAAGDKALDARTDVYSLASVLYEMLAGEPPFTGPTAQAIIAKRLTEPAPSVRAVRPTVPPAVDEAIRKALAPVPADRFATAAQFAQALHVTASGVTTAAATGRRRSRRRRRRAGPRRAPPPPRRPSPSPAVALTAGLLIGGGLLFAWRHTGAGAEPPSGTRVVAVLPFDNLGDSSDAYFADGVSDEVRTKLGQVAGLEVIARGSSLEYRHTTKRPSEIAHELGADYLLTGTVRWEKSGGASRVRVTPELVDARPGQAARSRWGEQFDASLTDVFQVQGDIATKVADALGVALADSTQRELTAKPTENLAAYDEFLKGEAASQAMSVTDPASLRRAIGFYERAVALDSTFAMAWARLSHARTRLYAQQRSRPCAGRAGAARGGARPPAQAERSAWSTGPSAPTTRTVNPVDFDRAVAEYEQGVRLSPDNVGLARGARGRTSRASAAGTARRRGSRARRCWIRAPRTVASYWPMCSRSFGITPRPTPPPTGRSRSRRPIRRSVWQKVMVALARGDLDSARAVIRAAARQIDPATLFSLLARIYQDLYWVLDDDAAAAGARLAAERVRRRPGNLGDRPGPALSPPGRPRPGGRLRRLGADRVRGAEPGGARRRPAPRRCSGWPWPIWDGRRTRCGKASEGWSCSRSARTPTTGPYIQLQLARIYLLVGEPEKALDQLEPLLRIPYYLSPGWLRIDPTFDPLRSNPRFRKLVEGTA